MIRPPPLRGCGIVSHTPKNLLKMSHSFSSILPAATIGKPCCGTKEAPVKGWNLMSVTLQASVLVREGVSWGGWLSEGRSQELLRAWQPQPWLCSWEVLQFADGKTVLGPQFRHVRVFWF